MERGEGKYITPAKYGKDRGKDGWGVERNQVRIQGHTATHRLARS